MNIDGLGEETVDLLYEKRLIRNAADLYQLNTIQLEPLERLGEKSAQNIIEAIDQSRYVPYERVLYALGIRFVGETVARILARHFPSMNQLQQASVETLTQVPEIGEKIAGSVVRWFADSENDKLVGRLKEIGLQMVTSVDREKSEGPLAGRQFVVSGVFSHFSRDGIKQFIVNHGGKVTGSPTSNTDYLVAGEKPGPAKIDKANSLGIEIINEEDLINLAGT
jgi:DNA ligase (NAD+)